MSDIAIILLFVLVLVGGAMYAFGALSPKKAVADTASAIKDLANQAANSYADNVTKDSITKGLTDKQYSDWTSYDSSKMSDQQKKIQQKLKKRGQGKGAGESALSAFLRKWGI